VTLPPMPINLWYHLRSPHFNPAVTVADALQGGIAWREAPAYIVARIAGAFSGVGAAHIMFGLPLFSLVPSRAEWGRPVVERVHRYLRLALGHLGMLSHSAHSTRLCRGSLYHCGVLVHGFDFICPSRGYTGPRCQRHLRRDSSC
jgi:hypothetical protein